MGLRPRQAPWSWTGGSPTARPGPSRKLTWQFDAAPQTSAEQLYPQVRLFRSPREKKLACLPPHENGIIKREGSVRAASGARRRRRQGHWRAQRPRAGGGAEQPETVSLQLVRAASDPGSSAAEGRAAFSQRRGDAARSQSGNTAAVSPSRKMGSQGAGNPVHDVKLPNFQGKLRRT